MKVAYSYSAWLAKGVSTDLEAGSILKITLPDGSHFRTELASGKVALNPERSSFHRALIEALS